MNVPGDWLRTVSLPTLYQVTQQVQWRRIRTGSSPEVGDRHQGGTVGRLVTTPHQPPAAVAWWKDRSGAGAARRRIREQDRAGNGYVKMELDWTGRERDGIMKARIRTGTLAL